MKRTTGSFDDDDDESTCIPTHPYARFKVQKEDGFRFVPSSILHSFMLLPPPNFFVGGTWGEREIRLGHFGQIRSNTLHESSRLT